jgi:hypothetical protein
MSMRGSRSDEKRSSAVRNLKNVARALLAATDDDAITVIELACSEPGCPPLETVIAVLRPGREPEQVKIHKPIVDVSEDDVREAVRQRQAVLRATSS